jgi:hypothetical protein
MDLDGDSYLRAFEQLKAYLRDLQYRCCQMATAAPAESELAREATEIYDQAEKVAAWANGVLRDFGKSATAETAGRVLH